MCARVCTRPGESSRRPGTPFRQEAVLGHSGSQFVDWQVQSEITLKPHIFNSSLLASTGPLQPAGLQAGGRMGASSPLLPLPVSPLPSSSPSSTASFWPLPGMKQGVGAVVRGEEWPDDLELLGFSAGLDMLVLANVENWFFLS